MIYRQDERMWKKLAQINYMGFIYNYETQKTHYDTNYFKQIQLVLC